MKNILKILTALIIIISVSLASCKKSDDALPSEKPTQAFLKDSTVTFSKGNLGNYELGFKFYSSKAGSINQLGLYVPEAGVYAVSIWDFDSKALLAQKVITVSTSSTYQYENITPLLIVANKKYVLSYNTNSKLYFRNMSKTNTALYPFTKGNITIEGNYYSPSTTSIFPLTLNNLSYFFGFPDFNFQPTK